MIICPKCGKELSEDEKKCGNCGEVLVSEEKDLCSECGKEGEEVPTENKTEDIPQKVEVAGVRLTKKTKKLILIAVAVIIATASLISYKNKKDSEDYVGKLTATTNAMLLGAGTAENCGNLIIDVWSNTIYKERDSETDKYTRRNGYWVTDFNEALYYLLSDDDFKVNVEIIEANQERVEELMKGLANPPKEYKDAYDTMLDMYKSYKSFTNNATTPSGNLRTFSSNFNNNDSELVNYFSTMELYTK